ncbi:hypothetical protein N7486_006268 [Penicillium sp. IBT 16267x]|nr:hypothetical protein N7486_006268 [Penicillium sp. IBT 16267x]
MAHQQQNAHAGGSLTEMAPTGTSIPNNAGKQNIIPSIPRPDQRTESSYFSYNGLAQPTTAMAVDNATDIPRSIYDHGQTGEVMTGTGDSLPAGVESKRVYMGMNIPGRSGDERKINHQGFSRSEYDNLVGQYESEEQDYRKIGVHQVRNH